MRQSLSKGSKGNSNQLDKLYNAFKVTYKGNQIDLPVSSI